jgi:hypothetical protein
MAVVNLFKYKISSLTIDFENILLYDHFLSADSIGFVFT